jgi:hypothetical protein
MDEDFRKAALDYHRLPRPGKLAIEATKRMATQRDLGLAYSPGVAAPCEAIAANPDLARDYTARGNLVAVISNGTAVLGLGNIGPLASKPVMEGKAVLFKKFAGIDVFDLEVDAEDPDRFIEVVAALEPTFGGINLEDIKAPECFIIERKLRERMNIPVFHDDQHGTAIVCAAAVRNALVVQGKTLKDVKLVTSGAGAAALACVDLLVSMGLPVENVTLTDIKGVVYAGREPDMLDNMARYARQTDARTLSEVLAGADIFLGLSAPRVFKAEWLPLLAPNPLILAMANPEPEILPELVAAAAPRRHHGHRPQRLSQPGQQRPVLPVHLPRRAGRRRLGDQRGHEGGGRRGHRRTGPGRGLRGRGQRLWRRRPDVRRPVHHPQAVRPAPDPADRPGRGPGGHGQRRRHPADRRLRRLSRRAGAVRLSLGPADAAGVRAGPQGHQGRRRPRGLCRGRGRARAARRPDRARRRPLQAGADRQARDDHRQGRRNGPAAGLRQLASRSSIRPPTRRCSPRWSSATRAWSAAAACRPWPPSVG